MACLFQINKTISLGRFWTMGILGAWLSFFAGNAAAWCEFETFWMCHAPAVSLSSPANGATYASPGSFPLTASVNNQGQEASIVQVAFFVNNTLFQTVTTAPYSVTYTPPAGGTYTFKATATETNHGTRTGTSSQSSVTVVTLPNAPSALGAVMNVAQIDLSWMDNSNNETGFKIERKTGAGGTYSQIATVAANVTTYSDTGVSVGSTYYYRVRSTNFAGDSSYSSEAIITAGAPNGPSNLQAWPLGIAQVNLTWTDGSNNESGFKIERKTGAGGSYAQIAVSAANAISYRDTGLAASTTYYYRIRATNSIGDSAYSNESNGTTDSGANVTSGTLEYTYDPFGNLIRTNAGGAITTLSYDLRGRKTQTIDPDMGNWTYKYNAASDLVRQRDAIRQQTGPDTTMTYDPLGRMTNRTEPDLISTWSYDTCTKGVGKLCQVTADSGFQKAYAYDGFGRPASLTTNIDATYTITRTYDAASRISTLAYPDGFTVLNVYNSFGYLSEVRNNADSSLLWRTQALSASGRVTQALLGDSGVTTTRAYDALDRLAGISASGSAGTVQNLAYSYDAIGNLTQRVDNTQGLTENFAYDNLNRLLASGGPGLITRSYDYDAIGNLTYKSDVGTYTYGAKPHAVSSVSGTVNASYSYDANGNLTSGAGRTLSYMSFNLPRTISQGSDTFQYTYSADHERVRLQVTRASGTYQTIYLHPGGGGNLFYEKETFADGTVEHRHYVNGAGLIGTYVTRSSGGSPGMRYFHRDHIGSLVAITNASGAPIESLAYEAYGKRRFTNGTADPNNTIIGVTTERGFTGHEHLDELGLIHMNGRVYDPLLGRFMTADPFVPDPADRQSFNRYSYVLNKPMGAIDPEGFAEQIFPREGTGGDSGLGFGGRDSLNWEGDGSVREPGCPGCFDVPDGIERITITATRLDDFSWVPDSTLSIARNGAGFADFAFGAGQFSNVANGQWRGANGKWYSQVWGGNQWTGPRSAAINSAKAFEIAGRASLVLGLTVNGAQGAHAALNNDTFGAAGAGIDATIGLATALGGPVGWAIGAGYFGLEYSGGKEWFQGVLTEDFCIISGKC